MLHVTAWEVAEVTFDGEVFEMDPLFPTDNTRLFAYIITNGIKRQIISLLDIDIWYECACRGCGYRAVQQKTAPQLSEFCVDCQDSRCDAYPSDCPAIKVTP